MTISYYAIEFASSGDAIQYADASAGEAVLLDGKPRVVSQRDAERFAAVGVEFAYLVDHAMADGSRRIMAIPIN